MKSLKRFSRRPTGQVLIATLLFCFVFLVLFTGLYKVGTAHVTKTRASRAADMAALSGGAVYANGLQLVRYSNVVLMAAASVDMVKMATAAAGAGLFTGGTGALPAALAADRINFREPVQRTQALFFGVENPTGVYPALIAWESHVAARQNGFKPGEGQSTWKEVPIPPLQLYNFETTPSAKTLIPSMALRFRTAADLLPELDNHDETPPRYYYTDHKSGIRHYFQAQEVEPMPNSRNPGQMRMRRPPHYIVTEEDSNIEEAIKGKAMPRVLSKFKWALKALKPLLEKIKLDVTHRDDPHQHTLALYGPYSAPIGTFQQTSEIRLVGGGLAAWDVTNPPFKTRLVNLDLAQLPYLKSLSRHLPRNIPGLSTPEAPSEKRQ